MLQLGGLEPGLRRRRAELRQAGGVPEAERRRRALDHHRQLGGLLGGGLLFGLFGGLALGDAFRVGLVEELEHFTEVKVHGFRLLGAHHRRLALRRRAERHVGRGRGKKKGDSELHLWRSDASLASLRARVAERP